MRKYLFFFVFIISFLFSGLFFAYAQPQANDPKMDEPAGEFYGFGVKVPLSNFYFVKSVINVFGNKWSAPAQNNEELENQVWEQLLLSYESFKRGIKVEPSELDAEIEKTLGGEKVNFKWKEDKESYAKWVKQRTGEPVELFENQLKHLIQIQKLRQQVMDGIKPQSTEEEAHQEFLNEWNTLSVELAQFDSRESAEAFYNKVRRKPKLWEKEVKAKPDVFKRPGFVALEFLMEMWGFPKDDAYKMLKLDLGAIYPVAKIYGSKYGVFKILEKRLADETKFAEHRKSFIEQIELKKKYSGLNDWLKNLKEEAGMRIYEKTEVISPNAEEKQ